MYWPRMNEEVKEFISRCEVCRVYQDKQQKEPMIGHDIPSRPSLQLSAKISLVKSRMSDMMLLA